MRVTFVRTQVPVYSPLASIAEQEQHGGVFTLRGDFATDALGVHVQMGDGETQVIPWTNVAHARYRAEAPVQVQAAHRKGGR